jgi:hypothetical protein
MLVSTLDVLAGACAVLAVVCAVPSVLALIVAGRRPAISAAPAMGCAMAGLIWAVLAVGLAWMSSALAGR